MTLRARIILAFAVAMLVCTAAVLAVQTRSRLAAQDAAFLAQARMITDLSAQGLGGALRFGKADAVEAALAGLRDAAGDSIAAMAGFTAAGDPLARVGNDDPTFAALAARAVATGAAAEDGFRLAWPARFGKDNQVVGALVIGWSNAALLAQARGELIAAAAQALALVALVAVGFWWVLGRSLFRPLARLGTAVQALARGESAALPYRDRRDEIGALARDMAAIDDQARETKRIKTALDKARSSVMIAGPDGRILYVNEGMAASFARHEAEVARTVPGFRAGALVGMDIAVFGLSPATEVEKREIALGARRFELVQTPVHLADGSAGGAMLQWRDRTEMLATQAAIAEVAAAVAAGDFGRRIDLRTDDPLTNAICDSFNALADAVATGIDAVMTVAGAIAEGDLTRRMEGRFGGRFAELQAAMNGTVDRLSDLVAAIQTAAREIDGRIRSIAAEAGELADRAHAQAASLEQANATLEEIAAANRQSAETAAGASEAAAEAARGAREGSSVVGEAVSAITRIEDSSARIAEIVGVIDSIALQTNLLALNAAVEAARAGEAGKGFAVVADEVRGLAQRSSQAARDIRALIESSAGEIAQGVALVRRTGDVLTALVGAIAAAESRSGDISAQSRDQASAMQEITGAIAHLDGITQANTAMAEASATGARALRETAERLAGLVAAFRTAETRRRAA